MKHPSPLRPAHNLTVVKESRDHWKADAGNLGRRRPFPAR